MSLFEDDRYNWRETYFVLFNHKNRPSPKQLEKSLKKLGPKVELRDMRVDEEGRFESVTLVSPDDYAGMDIVFVAGEEVVEQLGQLTEDLSRSTLAAEETKKLQKLADCDARFDVFHFEQVMFEEPGDESDFLDPGALLGVLNKLAETCKGVTVDPQSGTFV